MTDLTSDRNFDDLTERFGRTIYRTPKGQLRLAALRKDFSDLNIPVANSRILDLGGGQGQFSLELARAGGILTLCDISKEMTDVAAAAFAQASLPIHIENCSLQSFASSNSTHFDLVLSHAVLEWLEDPAAGLQSICEQVRPGGWLSLMFYNLRGHQWRQIMNGRTHASRDSNTRLRSEGNAPQHPLDPEWVFHSLESLGFEIAQWRGIRCVHDHMHQKIRERIGSEKVEVADLEFGLIDPFRQLGRYIHVMAKRNETTG